MAQYQELFVTPHTIQELKFPYLGCERCVTRSCEYWTVIFDSVSTAWLDMCPSCFLIVEVREAYFWDIVC